MHQSIPVGLNAKRLRSDAAQKFMKLIFTLDTECYPNYFLVMLRNRETGALLRFEVTPDSEPLKVSWLHKALENRTLISFNGIDYDLPMIALAMSGAPNEVLKSASNAIIEQGLRSWQFERMYNVQIPNHLDHIDLMETVPGVKIGLKLYGARMHTKRIQDLPYEHTRVLTRAEMKEVHDYCETDHIVTSELYNVATDPKDNIIATRIALGDMYGGFDLRSKSDAQCAETIMKYEIEMRTGVKPKSLGVRTGVKFKYVAPEFIKFSSPKMQEVLSLVQAVDFTILLTGKVDMPNEIATLKIKLNGMFYKMGIGGLHSTEKSTAHVSDGLGQIYDRDFTSFYPYLMLQCGLCPSSLGQEFQRVLETLVELRVKAKREGNMSVAQTLKIVINGIFGKLGNIYSVMYSPELLIQVTITGQLILLMMIERLGQVNIPVLSANTDGVVMKCAESEKHLMQLVIESIESETGLKTEETRYRALYSRDVNNYLAVKMDGSAKTKGVLTPPGIAKNPSNAIVYEAAVKLLTEGEPIGTTILGCQDIRKFVSVKRVTGGGEFERQYLGKTVRWYRGRSSTSAITYVKNGNQVGGSTNAQPVMTLPDQFPDDIDYDFYLQETNDLLKEIGYV
jgi:hypothetical protein